MLVCCEDVDMDEPEPSPMFEISYNDEFPLAKRKYSRKPAEHIGAIPEERILTQFSFDSISSFNDEDNQHLNHGYASSSNIEKVSDFNSAVFQKLSPLYEEIVDKENHVIRYHNLGESSHFCNFMNIAKDLQSINPAKTTTDERLAFYINIYNMMVVHMTDKYGPPQDLWQRRKLVNTTYYQIHEHKYSLHSILNGILRSNRKGHGMLWKPFGKDDLRLPLTITKCDPLVHFAVISSTKSSPTLRVYSSENVRKEMKENAIAYVLDDRNMLVDTKRQILHVPKVFKWYAGDFGTTSDAIVEWILNLLEDDESEKAKSLRDMCCNVSYSMEYVPYNWEFNGFEDQHE